MGRLEAWCGVARARRLRAGVPSLASPARAARHGARAHAPSAGAARERLRRCQRLHGGGGGGEGGGGVRWASPAGVAAGVADVVVGAVGAEAGAVAGAAGRRRVGPAAVAQTAAM